MFLGVDPGKSGAMAVVCNDGLYVDCVKLSETPRDVADWLHEYAHSIKYAVIEQVTRCQSKV